MTIKQLKFEVQPRFQGPLSFSLEKGPWLRGSQDLIVIKNNNMGCTSREDQGDREGIRYTLPIP